MIKQHLKKDGISQICLKEVSKKMEGLLNGIMVFLVFIALFLVVAIWAIRSDAVKEDAIYEYIENVCGAYDISPELVQAIIEKESGWEPDARNGRCIGLMQIDPAWHTKRMKRLGVTDLTDPKQNILVGVDYLHELFEEYGDLYAVLMFYNGGYSEKYGIGAYKNGRYSEYAEEIATRVMVLEMLHGK